jgi:hypothetical protein
VRGTLALSWGPSGGVYVNRGYCKRVCLGPVALTYIPDTEIEDLMRAYVEAAEARDEFDGAGCCPEEDGYLRARARQETDADEPTGSGPFGF